MNLETELTRLIERLNTAHIDYAICGGLAMAIHGWPRATMDVDLLIRETDYLAVRDVARGLGYAIENREFTVGAGQVRIRRLVKIEGEQAVPLDLILVGPVLEPAWTSRYSVYTEHGTVWVVSREGLVLMKRLRASKQDTADIDRIEEGGSRED